MGHSQRMGGNVQDGVEISGLSDFAKEIFIVPVQSEGLRRIQGLGEILGIGSYVVGKDGYGGRCASPLV